MVCRGSEPELVLPRSRTLQQTAECEREGLMGGMPTANDEGDSVTLTPCHVDGVVTGCERDQCAKPTSAALRRRRRQRAAQGSGGRTQTTACCQERRQQHVSMNRKNTAPAKWSSAPEGLDLKELAQGLRAGGAGLEAALEALRGHVVVLSFHVDGCRIIQQALEEAGCRALAQHLVELHGFVREAIRSPHANYVLQKIVEVMPPAQTGFIVEELRGAAAEVACHRFGCRVLCRLVEHSATDDASVALIDEVVDSAGMLCRQSFGHYVVQSILEHGLPRQRQQVCAALCNDLLRCVRSRYACYVVESALSFCAVEDQRSIVDGLLSSDSADLAALVREPFGSYTVRALLRQPGEVARRTRTCLEAVAEQLQDTKYSRRVLEDMETVH